MLGSADVHALRFTELLRATDLVCEPLSVQPAHQLARAGGGCIRSRRTGEHLGAADACRTEPCGRRGGIR